MSAHLRGLLAWKPLTKLLARPRRGGRSGSVAVQFALVCMPIMVISLAAIDLHRVSAVKASLQDALDAATLKAARSTAVTQTDLTTVGAAALNANLRSIPDVTLKTDSFVPTNSDVVGRATMKIDPIIGDMITGGSTTIGVTSTVTRSVNKIELALVLDNTGSMADTLGSGTKLTALKTAASSLVDTLSTAAQRSTDPNAVRIAVAPFSMTVNVGSTYQAASWITGTQPTAYGTDLFTTAQNRFTLLSNMHMTWAGCVELRPAPYDVQDTAPNSAAPATMFVPYFAPDEPDASSILKSGSTYYSFPNNYITQDFPAPAYSSTTTYAVGDEVYSSSKIYVSLQASNKNKTPSSNATYWRLEKATHDTVNTWQARQGNPTKYTTGYTYGYIASGASGTGSTGPNANCSMTPILRLTNNFTTVKSKLTAMQAVGNTNVPMGMAWGWHLLSPNAPFADGAAYGTDKLSKIVVLLTDGDNTNDVESNPENSIYLGVGYIWQGRLLNSSNVALDATSTAAQRTSAMDSRFAKICANMKAQNIIIYTIGLGVSTSSGNNLKACATSTDKYFDVTDTAQLTAVFNTIAGAISNLRISH